MLIRPAHLVIVLLAVSIAGAAGTFATGTVDTDRVAETLPRQLDWRTAPQIERFEPTVDLAGRSLRYVNTELVERDVERAVRSLVAGRAGGVPARLVGGRPKAARLGIGAALAGIPARELELSLRSVRPTDPSRPWLVKVVIDVREVAGKESPFVTPSTTVEFRLRPAGDVRGGVVERWQVERVEFERGGLLLLDRRVTYQRRGVLAVAAPASARELAATTMSELAAMLPQVERDWPGLRGSDRGIFVVLVSARRGSHRALAQVDQRTFAGDTAGIATFDGVIALNLKAMQGMLAMERRSLLRHELVHVVTNDLARTASDTWSEGLAEWEGDHEIVRAGSYYLINGPAVDAMQSGKIRLDDFLFSDRDFGDRAGVERGVQYRLAAIVADYVHEQHGHRDARRLYRLLADGVAPKVAVRRALGMAPGAFRAGVERWAASHRTWHG